MVASQRQPVERPIAAFVLSMLAGLSLLARCGMIYGWGHGAWRGGMHSWMGQWGPDAFGMGWSWCGWIAGVVLVVAAVALYVRPEARRGWGIVILVTSGLQLLLGRGGFLAAALSLVGGVLALLGARSTAGAADERRIPVTVFHGAMRAVLLSTLVAAAMPVLAQAPAQSGASGPTDSEVRELQEQIKSLQQQLDKLNATQNPASRRRLMEENWQGMQGYMGRMHERWRMGGPWMMGPGMAGCPMTGGGGGWPLPEEVTPETYRQQMLDHMQRMNEQMNQIAHTTDPKERQRLMEEHWGTKYRDMQTMRGMGRMWSGPMMGRGMMGGGMMRGGTPTGPAPSAEPLPDPASAGAKFVSTYCTQCHAAPQPTLHTAKEWSSVTQRMHARMDGGWGEGIKTPTEQEMQTIVAYMQKHARQAAGR